MFISVGLKNRADGRIDFCVHQHDVLAVFECLEQDVRAELDRAGRVHYYIHMLRARE